MKKTRIGFMIISWLLVCAVTINLTACTMQVQAKDLMEGIMPNTVNASDDLRTQNATVTDFAIRLFKASEENGKNTLISPLSVLCALAMTANGAKDETLQQMESVLGMTTEQMNLYLYSYMQNLPQGDKYKLNLANSIWFAEDEHFTVNKDFLQTNADYYKADVYKAPFDNQTCKDINSWVSEKTDKMIPEILDSIPADAVMYLVNALAFDAEWSEPYERNQIIDDVFTQADGTRQDATFMHSTEGVYLEDEKATGFMRYYKGDHYAFVAMLPNEGVSVSEYIASLNGESLNALLTKPQYTTVNSAIPKFETAYDVEMSKILQTMGMPNAFDPNKAAFEKLGTSTAGNIYINRVLHKTFISVGEKGTKAGAATIVEIWENADESPDPKEVYLDRPFVYMLVDCKNHIPFFIGTMTDIEK